MVVLVVVRVVEKKKVLVGENRVEVSVVREVRVTGIKLVSVVKLDVVVLEVLVELSVNERVEVVELVSVNLLVEVLVRV